MTSGRTCAWGEARECWAVRGAGQGLDAGRLCGSGVRQGRCGGVKETQTRGACPLSRSRAPRVEAPCAPTRPFPPPAPACLLPLHPMHLPPRPSTHSSPPTALRPPPSAGRLGDLHSFDPATMTWTPLSPADDPRRPSARSFHGFTSAGGLLYVHGGLSDAGSSLSLRGARIRLP